MSWNSSDPNQVPKQAVEYKRQFAAFKAVIMHYQIPAKDNVGIHLKSTRRDL